MATSSAVNSLTAAGQLGHRGQLPRLRPGRLPPPGAQHPDQLVIGQHGEAGLRIVNEPG